MSYHFDVSIIGDIYNLFASPSYNHEAGSTNGTCAQTSEEMLQRKKSSLKVVSVKQTINCG
jgi:hypothetical protein